MFQFLVSLFTSLISPTRKIFLHLHPAKSVLFLQLYQLCIFVLRPVHSEPKPPEILFLELHNFVVEFRFVFLGFFSPPVRFRTHTIFLVFVWGLQERTYLFLLFVWLLNWLRFRHLFHIYYLYNNNTATLKIIYRN